MPELYVKKKKPIVNSSVNEKNASHSGGVVENLSSEPSTQRREIREEVRQLASFCPVPEGARFETQEANEEIILLLRAHVITNIPWILIATLMLVAPMILRIAPAFSFFPDRFLAVGTLFWYLLTIAFIFEQFLNWYFNVYIVTDERIVDVDFANLLYKKVSETKLDKIQDVTYSQVGVARSLFNYGNVFVQTAGEVTEFEFLAVPRPDRVAAAIRALITEEEIEAIEGRVS
jgi:hypothetical protein